MNTVRTRRSGRTPACPWATRTRRPGMFYVDDSGESVGSTAWREVESGARGRGTINKETGESGVSPRSRVEARHGPVRAVARASRERAERSPDAGGTRGVERAETRRLSRATPSTMSLEPVHERSRSRVHSASLGRSSEFVSRHRACYELGSSEARLSSSGYERMMVLLSHDRQIFCICPCESPASANPQPRRALERPSSSPSISDARSPHFPGFVRPRGPSFRRLRRTSGARATRRSARIVTGAFLLPLAHAASPFVVARVVERSTHSLTHSSFLSTRVVVSAATPAALESDDWTAFEEAVDAFNDDFKEGRSSAREGDESRPSLVAALESALSTTGKPFKLSTRTKSSCP